HAHLQLGDHGGEVLFGAALGLLGGALGAQVVDDDLVGVVVVPGGEHGDGLDRDGAAVQPAQQHLGGRRGGAHGGELADAAQHAGHRGGVDEAGERLADDFGGRTGADQADRGVVDVDDDPVLVHADPVRCVLDQ